jgi:hypothetical protein
VNAQVVWLEGMGVEPSEVGARAAALARLRAEGLAVPRAFALGRSLYGLLNALIRRDELGTISKLPPQFHAQLAEGLRALGGSCAIRRSPLDKGARSSGSWQTITGGRPERETYLHLTDVADVAEAVRRIWTGQNVLSVMAIIVQRFIVPEVCAVVRRDRADDDVLHVQSTLGVGDLLAAGLVVPDRHTLRKRDGSVLASALGRKAQMSVPRPDGGVIRVPVPARAARQLAVDEPKLLAMAEAFRAAETAVGPLSSLALAWSGGRWFVTSAVPAQPEILEGVMLG